MQRTTLTLLALLALALGTSPVHAEEEQAARDRVQDLVKTDLPGKGKVVPAPGAPAPTGPRNKTDAFTMRASGRLEFHARNLDVADALAQLRRLLRTNIVVSPEVNATFTGDLYDVTLTDVLDAICRSTKLRYRQQGSILYVEPEGRSTKIFRLSYARAEDVIPLLQPLVSPDGQIVASTASETGIGSSQDDAGGDSYAGNEVVVVTDYAPNLDDITAAVESLDRRPRQVFIEATICSADVDRGRELGIEFTALAGIDFNSMGATSKGTDGVELGNVPGNGFDDGIGAAETNLLDGLSTSGLNVGVIGNSAAAFVRALRTVTNVNVLANPRVLAVNKQRGEVIVGRRDGYLTTIVTETQSIQEVEFLETGTRLIFRPFIGEDGWIRMEIHPEDSEGGVNADGLPFKDTAEVTTNLLVKSGQTIVIGGLLRERHNTRRRGLPGVGNLPGGVPFMGSDQRDVKREEVIIILTPRIVEPEEDAPETGDAKAQKKPLGTSRLADSYARVADRAVCEGRFDRARAFLARVEQLDPEHPVLKRMAALRKGAPAERLPSQSEVATRLRQRAAAAAPKPPVVPVAAPAPATPRAVPVAPA
nr:secretin N-terminal domain-containing protein [Planctomycetota bacterium]